MELHAEILVVGAGPAGLSTAIELANRGIEVLIIERRPQQRALHPRATALSRETMRLFRSWGIADAAVAAGFQSEHVLSVRPSLIGPEIDRVPMDDHEWTCAQDRLEPIMRRHATSLGVRILQAASLVDLDESRGRIRATIAQAGASSGRVHCRYLVGADGARSVVRTLAQIAVSESRDFGEWMSILFHSPLRDYTGDTPCMVYVIDAPTLSGVVLPTDAGDRWIRGVPARDEGAAPRHRLTDQAAAVMVRAAVGVPDIAVRVEAVQTFRMVAALAASFQAGRVLLVGDAAHVFPPASGMGMNLAIGDGVAVARALERALRHGDRNTALAGYEEERRPLVERHLLQDLAPAAAPRN